MIFNFSSSRTEGILLDVSSWDEFFEMVILYQKTIEYRWRVSNKYYLKILRLFQGETEKFMDSLPQASEAYFDEEMKKIIRLATDFNDSLRNTGIKK